MPTDHQTKAKEHTNICRQQYGKKTPPYFVSKFIDSYAVEIQNL